MKSWIEYDLNCDFPIENLPYGVFSVDTFSPRIGVAIGDQILDMSVLFDAGLLSDLGIQQNLFAMPCLNLFAAGGKTVWKATRARVSSLLVEDNDELRKNEALRSAAFVPISECKMHVPFAIQDYVDFYSSEQHATNVGKMFRPDNPLMPNWKHLPVGYNGRASSVVISGTEIRRPMGQTMPDGAESPIYGPCKRLDYELEMGFFTGKSNPLGQQVSTAQASDFIFGLVIVNDWSARDIQKWEYQPLGPFLAKTFGTSVSPWVVSIEALEPFRTSGPAQSPAVLPYLQCASDWAFDIQLEVALKTTAMSEFEVISKGNFKTMYWNMAQQLAHQCVNGTNIQVGDLYASGTISGDTTDSAGCLLEMTTGGKNPVTLANGEQRRFLEDGDEVRMRAWCQGDGYRIGFGEVVGRVLQAVINSGADS